MGIEQRQTTAPRPVVSPGLTPPATPPETPPESPNKGHRRPPGSRLRGNTTSSTVATTRCSQSHKEYLDSLVPPTPEEFRRIAQVQANRQDHSKRRSRELKRRSREMARRPESGAHSAEHSQPTTGVSSAMSSVSRSRPGIVDDILFTRAATLIQRTYRGYRVRRQMAGLGIDAETRWTHAIREARFRELTTPRAREESVPGNAGGSGGLVSQDGTTRSVAARRNWRKAAVIARRAGFDQDSVSSSDSDSDSDTESSSSSSSNSASSLHNSQERERRKVEKQRREESKKRRRKDAKTMGLQYFLEMVDLKHRYGSNLRTYHEEWKKADTHENFFYWLDYGEGRSIEIQACPRDRLDRECVRYLSREERQYYLVKVDGEGRLCWAKNDVRIDTVESWKDSIHGIVPLDDPTPAFVPMLTNETRLLGDSSTGESNDSDFDTSDSETEAARAAKYATPALDEAKGIKKVRHVSAATIFNKLLRKSIKKNTWIFVADTSFRLFVGIKSSGAFQHSSFLQGSRISAAGLIKIKNGRLSSLSPLSGHYRPPASNFRAFVKSLKEEGVDMTHVSISKSYAILVGLEAYVKMRKKSKKLVKKLMHKKDKIVAPEEVARREEEEMDKSQSAARERAVLEREAREREENKTVVQLMGKLRMHPEVPEGQKGGGGGEEGNMRAQTEKR